MAAGLARKAALAMRRELMMGGVVGRMQWLVYRKLLVNLRGRSSEAWQASRRPAGRNASLTLQRP